MPPRVSFCLLIIAALATVFYLHWLYEERKWVAVVNEIGRPHEEYANVDSKFGYNVGDLLNMPSFDGAYSAEWPPNGRSELVEIAKRIHSSHPMSIIGRYFQPNYTCCVERLPQVGRLRDVVAKYGEAEGTSLRESIESEQTLLIHVRSCDKSSLNKNFIEYAATLSRRFQTIILMGQCHHDTRYATQQEALFNLRKSFEVLIGRMDRRKVSLFPRASADDHVYAMSRAANLLVHRGGFSAVGALVCRGYVYYCEDMNAYTQNSEFLAHVRLHQSCRDLDK